MQRFKICSLLLIATVFVSFEAFSDEIDKTRIPPASVYQSMLDTSKSSGWVQFRDFNGNPLIYFTALQTLHCRLSEIRYSINSEALDQTFDLVACNPQTPFSLPPDAKPSDIYISLPLGTASSVAVQAVWEDGRKSAMAVYEPCKNVGDQTCAWPLK